MLWEARGQVRWELDNEGLPQLTLLHPGPWVCPQQEPQADMETDPWSILGNYGLTLFPHASGSYQVLHTERGFTRLNHDGGPRVTGRGCRARMQLQGQSYDLLDGSMQATFGCGCATWRKTIGDCAVERRLETVPSQSYSDRIGAALVVLRLQNTGTAALQITLEEGLAARFHVANWCNPPLGRKYADYPVIVHTQAQAARAEFQFVPHTPLLSDEEGLWAQADARPAQLCVEVVDGLGVVRSEPIDAEAAWLLAQWQFHLAPGETKELRLAVGWADHTLPWAQSLARVDQPSAALRSAWRKRLPQFPHAEKDLAAELVWHAHVLHAMATWDGRYATTFIPQGTLYEYGLGVAAVTRDHAMHALPTCYYDRDLARSVLRYLFRHTEITGRIQFTDEGAGLYPLGCDQKSDNQLFALLLLVEYLEGETTNDLLKDRDPFFPCGSNASGTVLDRIARWVRYLRDVVHVGAHGLVRILYSDLSDTLHHSFSDLPYSQVFNGESHVNTTMAICVLDRLAQALQRLPQAAPVQQDIMVAARDLSTRLRQALDAELVGHPWCPRGRVGNKILGQDDVFCASQSFILADEQRPLAERLALWQRIKARIWDHEPFGVRLREAEGQHRSGMVWYAWSGLFAQGLAKVDREAAEETLRRLRLRTRAEQEPQQWIGLWSHSDVTWAYRGAGNKIPGTTRMSYVWPFPIFCAHVHAWPLQIWFRLHGTQP